MGKMPVKKKWILSVISVALSLMVTGCSFNFGRNISPAYSWEDYSINPSDLAVSIETYQEDSIDCITLYGVGDLNVEFPCSTVTDLNKEGETVYEWSVIIDNFKVSLFYNYTYIGFSKKNKGSIAPKDMRAAIILKDGSESGDIKFEIKDNAICFYDVTLPGKTDCLQGVEKVSAECNIATNRFVSDDLALSINGKVCSASCSKDDFDSILSELGIVEVADNSGANTASNTSNKDEENSDGSKENSSKENETGNSNNTNNNSSNETGNSSNETGNSSSENGNRKDKNGLPEEFSQKERLSEYTPTYSSSNIAKIAASSNLWNQGASNLIDGKLTTCWSEGVKGSGAGQEIIVKFDSNYSLTGMGIANGCFASKKAYGENGKAVRITLTFADGESESFDLTQDDVDVENVSVSDYLMFANTHDSNYVRIKIDDATAGSKYEDTCISELYFD